MTLGVDKVRSLCYARQDDKTSAHYKGFREITSTHYKGFRDDYRHINDTNSYHYHTLITIINKTMKLFILNNVLSDYTSGMAVIAAESKEQCREIFIQEFSE